MLDPDLELDGLCDRLLGLPTGKRLVEALRARGRTSITLSEIAERALRARAGNPKEKRDG